MHIDYANAILAGLPNVDLKKLQRVQTMAAKLILQRDKYSSAVQSLEDLHWLNLEARIHYKVLTITQKCLNNNGPQYLSDL